MASTIGGFLVGVGLMLLLLASGGLYAVLAYYTPVYNEVMSYKPMIQDLNSFLHSPAVDQMLEGYRELAALMPQIEDMARAYASMYPQIIGFKDFVEEFYRFTHSDVYKQVLNAMRSLSDAIGNPIVSGVLNFVGLGYIVPLVQQVPGLMENIYGWSETAKQAFNMIEMVPPERVEAYVSSLKALLQMLPPDKLEGYVAQARAGSERALEVIQTMESYTPQQLFKYCILVFVFGTVVAGVGVILIDRARRTLSPNKTRVMVATT